MKIIYKNMEIEVNEGEKVIDAFEEEIKNDDTILACRVNNEIKNLNYVLKENDEVSLLPIASRDGSRIYMRGILFIMSMAFEQLFPDYKLIINYQLQSSTFCETYQHDITEEEVEQIKQRMIEIINSAYPINKLELDRQTVIDYIKNENNQLVVAQLENRSKKTISVYECEGYYNYFFGVMPITTGYTKIFDLMKYEHGFLVRFPDRADLKSISPYRETKKLLNTLTEYDDIYELLGDMNLDQINKQIRDGKGNELILLAEALHEKKIAEIAEKIATQKEKKMILIAGPSSSGKTTFARRLAIQLRLCGIRPKTISVDNYFVEREQTPRDEEGKYNFEDINAIDLDLLNDHLTKLLNGEEVELPTFDFKEGHKKYLGNKMKLEDGEVIVMEGIHCLNDALTPSIPKEQKFKVYISALTVLNIDYYNRISSTDTRIIRRTVRDNQFRGYDAKHTLEVWTSVSTGEAKNIFPFQEEADAMFNSSLIYEINALRSYALPLFERITREDEEYSEAKRICEFLKYFDPIDTKFIPKNSILQEFLGDSIFEDL